MWIYLLKSVVLKIGHICRFWSLGFSRENIFWAKILFCKHNLMCFSIQKLESTGKSGDRFLKKPKSFLVYQVWERWHTCISETLSPVMSRQQGSLQRWVFWINLKTLSPDSTMNSIIPVCFPKKLNEWILTLRFPSEVSSPVILIMMVLSLVYIE